MARKRGAAAAGADPFQRLEPKAAQAARDEHAHVYGNRIKCVTDVRGFATPKNDKRIKIVVDASEGYIPLWAKRSSLRWRFQEQSLSVFAKPAVAKDAFRNIFGEAILMWGNAAPVRFSERSDAWDFEIMVRNADDCDSSGCTLAMAFFPDPGRHQIEVYPRFFKESKQEQIETLAHELGHVFGLRHFFAKLEETEFPSEIFGKHKAFSIMNYGNKSKMTDRDRSDLRNLYQSVWDGSRTEINGTPIRLVRPFHVLAD